MLVFKHFRVHSDTVDLRVMEDFNALVAEFLGVEGAREHLLLSLFCLACVEDALLVLQNEDYEAQTASSLLVVQELAE